MLHKSFWSLTPFKGFHTSNSNTRCYRLYSYFEGGKLHINKSQNDLSKPGSYGRCLWLLRENIIWQGFSDSFSDTAFTAEGSEAAKAAGKSDNVSRGEGTEVRILPLQLESAIKVAICPMKSCITTVKSFWEMAKEEVAPDRANEDSEYVETSTGDNDPGCLCQALKRAHCKLPKNC